ncbi:TLC domain-containing protein 2 [Fukomys damarensis]|uniref:TLC domain-containing protein 2 n=1 Tax=Fukomys damarensis TaxID=885580 RepID=UPI0008FF259E|nr:TLC domain-containing protein 2 [Fukomys damarensis]
MCWALERDSFAGRGERTQWFASLPSAAPTPSTRRTVALCPWLQGGREGQAALSSGRVSLYPQLAADPVHGHPFWALALVAVSVGYFLADGADLLWNQTLGQAWDILCHHLVVVCCFSFAVLSGHYVGFSMVCLLVEVNSICLHLRMLLLTSHQIPSLAFSVTSYATLATLVLFRLVPLGWMSLWMLRKHHRIPLSQIILGGTGLVTVGAMSIRIGVRILISDVLRPRPHPPILEHEETRETRTCDHEPITRDNFTLNLKN